MKGLVRTLFVSALLLFGAATASPAAADNPPTTSGAPLYLALGDSWAFGFGATVPSEGGYVPQLHQALQQKPFDCLPTAEEQAADRCKQLQLVNRAVGGATTPTLIANQLPVAKDILEQRNFNDNPRDDVELITVHIGGNDVTNPIIAACLGGLSESCLMVIQAEFEAYATDLNSALSTLRQAAGPGTRIVQGTYDNPIAQCFLAAVPGAVQLGALVLEGGGPIPQGLHGIMREVGARYGVVIAEVYGDLGPADWVGGNDCLHPDDSGYDKVTAAFVEALRLP